jgi:hypothetical protein
MKVFFWGLVILGAGYAVYGAMMSGYQWLQIQNVVDEVLQPRNLRELPTAADVRTRIVREAASAGVPVSDREVKVEKTPAEVAIRVFWTFPMIVYNGETVLSIPLSVSKRHLLDGRAYFRDPAFASAMSVRTRARSSSLGATFTNRSHARTAPSTSFFAS